jgi:CO/xanthine dehydrogenase Mo-binding subunit
MEDREYAVVGKAVKKKDSMALLSGKPVYVDDIAPAGCLVVKLLHSPHAHALIEEIDTSIAMKVPGIEAIFTYKDVPQNRYTTAGQTYPEGSPYDRLILDRRVRFVGDPVAIVAGDSEKAVNKALKLIKVQYQILEPILDLHKSKDSEILIHPEEDWKVLCNVGADNKRNLAASGNGGDGDIEAVMEDCDIVFSHTYHTKQNQQTMMETFRTYASIDPYGRLYVLSSTQIVYHVRRILATALGISKSQIRVAKPRIGGGFGAKQTSVMEVYPAFVTWKTKKPCKMIFTRQESMTAGSPRHEMEITVRLGAMNDGTIRAIDLYTLSNTGAYGEHAGATAGLSGHKSIPLYNANLEAYHFRFDVVYTNMQSSGAYRGFGATQGQFALESMVNELAARLNMDPVAIREKNMVREGQVVPSYYNERMNACALDRCVAKAKELFGWDEKPLAWDCGNGKIRAKGVAISMQGSGVSHVDVGSATIKLNDDGFYMLFNAAGEMGMGSDTVLAQIAAECLECSVDNILVHSADSDISPYDSGSYASSTTYVTGKAVEKACLELREHMSVIAAGMLGCDKEELVFTSDAVEKADGSARVTLKDIANKSMKGNSENIQVTVSHSSPVSPPPFMAGMVELELDKETGEIKLLDYVAVADCGTYINSALARVQVEGGLAQGIGMALYEDVTRTPAGKIREDSFMQYKIPTRLDLPRIQVAFENSYEETGPYGAKSIGEVVINTPCPAIAHAVYNATGIWFRELPITPEKVLKGLKAKNEQQ